MGLEYYYIIIVLIGVYTSYIDYKFGLIKNKIILIGIFLSILFTFLSFFNDIININYVIKYLINGLIGLMVGFFLFYENIWSAGDGKLFFLYTILIPLNSYIITNYPFFPSFALLINIFVPSAIYMIISLLVNLKQINFSHKIKNMILKDLGYTILGLFVLSYILTLILNQLNINSILISNMSTIILFSYLRRKIPKNRVSIMILSVVAILRLIIDKNVFDPTYLYNFLFIIFIYKIVISFLLVNISGALTKKISIDKLQSNDILGEVITIGKKMFKKGYMINITDVILLKKHKKHIIISEKIPFAHLMFFGTLLTIIFKGNILIYLNNIF